jgi:hypothetical protein
VLSLRRKKNALDNLVGVAAFPFGPEEAVVSYAISGGLTFCQSLRGKHYDRTDANPLTSTEYSRREFPKCASHGAATIGPPTAPAIAPPGPPTSTPNVAPAAPPAISDPCRATPSCAVPTEGHSHRTSPSVSDSLLAVSVTLNESCTALSSQRTFVIVHGRQLTFRETT